jgi:hypothetical protein
LITGMTTYLSTWKEEGPVTIGFILEDNF